MLCWWYFVDDTLAATLGVPGLGEIPLWTLLVATAVQTALVIVAEAGREV